MQAIIGHLMGIAQFIWKLFKVRYHPSAVSYVIDRMGWSNQRPQHPAFQRTEEPIEHWEKEVLPEIKKDSQLERHTVLRMKRTSLWFLRSSEHGRGEGKRPLPTPALTTMTISIFLVFCWFRQKERKFV
jgi:hypothetical protein